MNVLTHFPDAATIERIRFAERDLRGSRTLLQYHTIRNYRRRQLQKKIWKLAHELETLEVSFTTETLSTSYSIGALELIQATLERVVKEARGSETRGLLSMY